MRICEETDPRKKPAEKKIANDDHHLISHIENKANRPVIHHLQTIDLHVLKQTILFLENDGVKKSWHAE